jgi:hypothetical protein
MLASAHVAAGAFAGTVAMRIRAPTPLRLLVAAVIGAGSHLAMDAVPHSDYAFFDIAVIPWVGLGEAIAACVVVAFTARARLAPGGLVPMMAGIASAMAPDVKFVVRVLAPRYEAPVTRVTDAFHGLHASGPLHIWLAFAGEVALAVGFFYLFRRLLSGAKGAAARSPGRSTAATVPPSAS